MRKETTYLLINILIGLGLAGIGLTSFTVGVYFEILIVGLLIGTPFFIFQIIKQTSWIPRIAFIALLGFQIHSFNDSVISKNFEASSIGYFLSSEQIENVKWIMPIAAGLCLTSFWLVLIGMLRSNKKTLPNKL